MCAKSAVDQRTHFAQTRAAIPFSDRAKADTLRRFQNQIRRARLRRYVGGTEPGGPCKRSMEQRKEKLGNGSVIAGCDGVGTCEGGGTRTTFGGDVVPFCAQLSAQHNFASATLGVSFCRRATLQQSISIMPSMLHSLSPKCSGTPAKALPARISRSNKDTRRFINIVTLFKVRIRVNVFRSGRFKCSRELRPPTTIASLKLRPSSSLIARQYW